ncbi:MAG: endolytic transglycosylase MltG [Alphaproteobacteria bacterium]|nr:endolytic transglycosylase MltG [Alphaproteobacteria bacterium]
MRRFFILLLILIALGAAAFFAEQWSFFAAGPQMPSGQATIVLINAGERSAVIAQKLQNAGVIRSGTLFRLGVQLRGKNTALRAGEYAIPSGSSMAGILGILTNGTSIQHKLTVAEGVTSQMIYDAVSRDPMLNGNPGAVPPEGSMLPETYLYTRGMERAAMLARMTRAQQKFIARSWLERKPNLPFNSPEEALTLASIVEKETAVPQERRHIAAVFINRLQLGMKLQSDPTIIYGLTKGYPLGRGIRESEIAAPTPYNTYAIAGLPPTPICNPGKDSIAAVLQPEDSSDLYFVANGSGGHVFTSSIAEHEKNVARLRQLERSLQAPPIAIPPSPTLAPLRGMRDTAPVARSRHIRRHVAARHARRRRRH